MSSVTGKDGYVTKQVAGVDTVIVAIKEWSIDYSSDIFDVTAFAAAAVTHTTKISSLTVGTGSFIGTIQSTDVDVDGGTAYNIMLNADDNRAYYGSAYIISHGASVTVGGEATSTYGFEFTGKVYVLGADVVVDGDFTGDGSDWDVSDTDVAYDATDDMLDFTGNADVSPDTNNIVDVNTYYWCQWKIENESGASTCAIQLGDNIGGTTTGSDGTYTEIIQCTSDQTTTIKVETDDAISVSEVIVREVLN